MIIKQINNIVNNHKYTTVNDKFHGKMIVMTRHTNNTGIAYHKWGKDIGLLTNLNVNTKEAYRIQYYL